VAYQRGNGSVELELSRVQSCLESLDPAVEDLKLKVDSLESSRDKMDGKLVIIVWLVGLNVTLMIGLLITLFGWGLGHITLKAEFANGRTYLDAATPTPEYHATK